jgi:hypothetical protein
MLLVRLDDEGDLAMADPKLTNDELRLLDFFIAKAEERGLSRDFQQWADAAADIMTGVPIMLGPEASKDTISAKVHATMVETLKTPGITVEQLKRIRKILRSL